MRVVIVGSLVPAGIAQQSSVHSNDFHLTQDSARNVYASSAFAHGHRHGYEEGFHFGDQDYQLRHAPNPSGKLPKSNGYKREFGEKKSYMQGFASGYRAGYVDSYSGQRFRSTREIVELESAISSNEQSPPVLSQNYLPKVFTYTFDAGVAQGYKDGFSSAEATSYAPGLGELASSKCEAEHIGQPAYCDGYAAGFLLGKDDIRSIREFQNESGKLSQKH